MQQLKLFPDDVDDAEYVRKSQTYRHLDDTGQRIVRGYISAFNSIGDWPTQAKIAETAGLARSTVSEKLKADGDIMAAVTEIIATTRNDLAVQTTIGIPALAILILRQFLPAEGRMPRDTRTLTKVEFDVLRLSGFMGGVSNIGPEGSASLTLGTRVNTDGTTETAVKLTTGDNPVPNVNLGNLDSVIKSLVEGQRQRITASEQETPNLVRVEEDTP